MPCYRVTMSKGSVTAQPIVEADTPAEAYVKAVTLAGSMLNRRLPWLLEEGKVRPLPASSYDQPIKVGSPVLLHPGGRPYHRPY